MPFSAVDPARYAQQLEDKLALLRERFAGLSLPPPEVFRSPPLHYRMRAEFRIWRTEDDLFYAMFPPGNKHAPMRVDQFPPGSERINTLMQEILQAARRDPTLGRKLYQVEFLTTLSGDALVSLIYHRPLDDTWEATARQLASALGISILGRAKGERRVIGRDHVLEQLTVEGDTLHYQQVEGSFTQPNAYINQHMLTWARDVTRDQGGDLLELYCGNGNFTVALASQFRRVLTTEVSKTSVASAEYNFRANGIENARVVRLSAEEFGEALAGTRPFRRLRETPLDGYDFSTALVDPPRAGVDAQCLALLARFPAILYISCNPDTLQRDLALLADTHYCARFAVFDQFPYTHHLECGAWLLAR